MKIYNQIFNPLRSVSGIVVPPPKTYEWGLQDLSDDTAGRTEDNVMHKNRKGQCVKLTLEWTNVNINDGSAILKAFNDEYVAIEYIDAMFGGYRTAEFYVGDRKSVLFNSKLGLWERISFNIIEKTAAEKGVGVANV